MFRLIALLGPILCSGALLAEAPWHTKLELANGGMWQKRIAVTIRNNSDAALAGETIAIRMGRGAGEIDLGDAPVQQIRACTADGTELLWRIAGSNNKAVTRGSAPAGSTLDLPSACEARSSETIYLYFDNPAAWGVPDFLETRAPRAKAEVTVGAVEALPIAPGPVPRPIIGGPHWSIMASVPNFDASPLRTMVLIDLSMLLARCGPAEERSIELTDGRQAVPAMRIGNSLVFGSAISGKSLQWYHVTAFQEGGPRRDPKEDYRRLMGSAENLVKNGDFEQGEKGLPGWDGADAKHVSTDSPGLFGQRCAKLQIAAGSNNNRGWFGARQDLPASAGQKYLVAAWVKLKDVEGSVRLHIHWLTASGALTPASGMGSIGPELTKTVDWALVWGIVEAPAETARLQLHLTHNGAGTIWHDGVVVAPVAAAMTGPILSKMSKDEGLIAAWPVDAVVKVFKEDLPPAKAQRPAELRLSAARNEAEPLQLAIRHALGAKGVKAVVEAPVGPGGAKLSDIAVNVIGYVPIDHKTNYYRSEAKEWQRRIPGPGASSDGWAGWWPDPLLPVDTFDLEAQTTQPVWITVNVPKDAAAGDYRGKVKLLAGADLLAEMPLVVHVWDFALPDHGNFKAIYDCRVGSQWTTGVTDKQEAWRKMSAFMARRRLSPDRISPEPAIKYENGKVIADFSQYDKAAEEYFNQLHHPHTYTPSMFYMFGWAHPPKKFAGQDPYEGKYPYEGVDRSRLRPEYKQAYQACLKAYLDHMRQKGWYDKVLLYVSDEPHFWKGSSWGGREPNPDIVPQMKAVCEMIHEVDPKLPIYSSTWWYVPAWDGFITAWGIGFHGIVPPEKIAEIRTQARVLWTTDGHMCTDTQYCAVERLLPHFCFKYGVEGYEFWGATWLTYDPYQFGWHKFIRQADKPGHDYYVRYPNGDGFIMYPGAPVGVDGPVSSVRMEQAREGVEDYEYLVLLRERIARARSAGKDVTAAQKAMDDAAALVSMPNSGGRFSTKLLPDPGRVLSVREAVARAIEGLR